QDSTLAKASNLTLLLPNTGEAGSLGLAPTNSSTATLVLGDMLTVCLMERRSFSSDDFKLRHPGGKIGLNLLKVKDVMNTADLPVLNEHSNSEKIVSFIKNSKYHQVGIINSENGFIGVINENSLSDFLTSNKNIKNYMNRSPFVVGLEDYVNDVIKQMKINNEIFVFVIEKNMIAGFKNLFDLI
ncbi:MAG TPA: hypothetical protein DCR21_05465, partial [Succinivibrionaceae bacterium]|nr:hypothetical protein [Succinivibrionaceae bacterium]